MSPVASVTMMYLYIFTICPPPPGSTKPNQACNEWRHHWMSYFPPETPVVWTVGSGCRGRKQNPHKGLSERSAWEWDHKETNIRTSPPIFILGSSKGGYCHPYLPVSTACLSKGQLQSSENSCPPLSALISYPSSSSLLGKRLKCTVPLMDRPYR